MIEDNDIMEEENSDKKNDEKGLPFIWIFILSSFVIFLIILFTKIFPT